MIQYQTILYIVPLTILTFLTLFSGPSSAQDDTLLFGEGVLIDTNMVGAYAVRPADMDGDGDSDIVAVAREGGQVTWYENRGSDGSTTLPAFTLHEIDSVDGAYAIDLADVDHDGDIDILLAAVTVVQPSYRSKVADTTGAILWYENSDARFEPHIITNEIDYPVSIVAADIDKDGDLDAVTASRNDNSVRWFESDGNSQPSFATHLINDSAMGAVSVDVADLDGDGDLDVISASEDDNFISWYANDGTSSPNFETYRVNVEVTEIPTSKDFAKSVSAADLDNDGDLDIAYASEDENTIGWYENDGAPVPSFTVHTLNQDAFHAKLVYTKDIDQDGDIDIFSASAFDDKIAWYENNGATEPAFTTHHITTSALGARFVSAADLDGDGDLDLMSASRRDDTIQWYPNRMAHYQASLDTQDQRIIDTRYQPRSSFPADFDQDGDLDLLSVSNNEVVWHENHGDQPLTFTNRVIATDIRGGRWAYAGDLDGDGDLDGIAAAKDDNTVYWYENDGTAPPTFTSHIVTSEADNARAALVADIDRDGDLDVYSASDGDNTVAWYENDGSQPPQFTRHVVTSEAIYVRSVYAADVDEDGDLDLMSASQHDNKVAWYENVSQLGEFPSFISHTITTEANGAQHIHADDLDGDGDLDILSASEYDNTIAWYENDGASDPTFQTHIIDHQALAVHAVYSSDLDLDGDLDVVAAIEESHSIVWYENSGGASPSFSYHLINQQSQNAHSIYAADLDQDGDLDVLSTSRDDGKIAWYENQTRPGIVEAVANEPLPKAEHFVYLPIISGEELDVRISEFMARNSQEIVDEDGDFSDWIELYNAGPQSVNLRGWYLTDEPDNLTKWQFPTQILASGDYLLLFASGKDRRSINKPFHTNFKLNASGEYLALVRPDGTTIAWSYAPNYPPQLLDISYGDYQGQFVFFYRPTPGRANHLVLGP